MLAAVVAAAAVLGDTTTFDLTRDPTDCSVPSYPARFSGTMTVADSSDVYNVEFCCEEDTANPPWDGCFSGNACGISHYYQCCGPSNSASVCVDPGSNQCTFQQGFEWCPLPAPPPAEELSSGAIGGIVVGAYLGVAGAFGAFAAYRGSHNYGTAAGV